MKYSIILAASVVTTSLALPFANPSIVGRDYAIAEKRSPQWITVKRSPMVGSELHLMKREEVKRTPEEVKREEFKRDLEEVKREEVKREEVKREEVKREEVKREEIKREEAKREEVKRAPEEVKREEVKREEVKRSPEEVKRWYHSAFQEHSGALDASDLIKREEVKRAPEEAKKRSYFDIIHGIGF